MRFDRHLFQKLSIQGRARYAEAMKKAKERGELNHEELTQEQRQRLKAAMDAAIRARSAE
jgi:TRAP-type C4-dicarboxylate transport system substrate-binding protein